MGGATGPRSPGERSPVCFVDAGACALGEAAGAEVQQHCFDPVRASAALGTRASAKLQLKWPESLCQQRDLQGCKNSLAEGQLFKK